MVENRFHGLFQNLSESVKAPPTFPSEEGTVTQQSLALPRCRAMGLLVGRSSAVPRTGLELKQDHRSSTESRPTESINRQDHPAAELD
jgi:hypothetical protein